MWYPNRTLLCLLISWSANAVFADIGPQWLAEASSVHAVLSSSENLTESELHNAQRYRKLLNVGAIEIDGQLNSVFAQAYESLGESADSYFDRLCDVFEYSATEESPTVEGLLNGLRALEFGRGYNKDLVSPPLKGINWEKADRWAGRMIKAFLPDQSHDFLNQVSQNCGRIMLFNLALSKLTWNSFSSSEQVNAMVRFLSTSKSACMADTQEGRQEYTKKQFELQARKSGLLLESVIPDKWISHYSELGSQTDIVIAAALDQAPKLQEAVYLLAFHGEDSFQFFTVSVFNGRMNIAFALGKSDPVPVLIASMKTESLNHTALAISIDNFMQGKNVVPNLLGIWRVGLPPENSQIRREPTVILTGNETAETTDPGDNAPAS